MSTAYHEKCFKTFMGTSVFYMLFICILLNKYRRRPQVHKEKYSTKLKWRFLAINVTSFAFAAYFFWRHNSMCEPYGKFTCRQTFLQHINFYFSATMFITVDL